MASTGRMRGGAPSAAHLPEQAPRGSVRACAPYAGELARHRVITADGFDFVVATMAPSAQRAHFTTAAYPVQQGYLVMVRQPLCELRGADADEAHEQHERLARVLAEAGVGVVRARRALEARRQAEHTAREETTLEHVSSAREAVATPASKR